MVVFTLLLNRVHVFPHFMFNLDREFMAVKGLITGNMTSQDMDSGEKANRKSSKFAYSIDWLKIENYTLHERMHVQ